MRRAPQTNLAAQVAANRIWPSKGHEFDAKSSMARGMLAQLVNIINPTSNAFR